MKIKLKRKTIALIVINILLSINLNIESSIAYYDESMIIENNISLFTTYIIREDSQALYGFVKCSEAFQIALISSSLRTLSRGFSE